MIKIPVKDPRTASTVANYVDVILDFTDFNPPYWLRSDKDAGESHWWYYQAQNNTVHVLRGRKKGIYKPYDTKKQR